MPERLTATTRSTATVRRRHALRRRRRQRAGPRLRRGNDTLYGGADGDTAYGEAGADTVYGDAGADTLYGGDQGDSLYGGADADTAYGDTGDDTVYGDAAADVLYGDDGDATDGGRVAGVTDATFTATPGTAIGPDGGTATTSTITIAGVAGLISDLDLQTFITHTLNGDLIIQLTSPSGTTITLVNRTGAPTSPGDINANGFLGTVWDDDAGFVLPDGFAFAGNASAPGLTPEELLAAFDGEDPNGTWTLTVIDADQDFFTPVGVGTLDSWSLTIDTVVPDMPDGADTLYGGDAGDVIYGDDGDDAMATALGGGDTLYGGAAGDTLYGESNSDTLYGDAGADTLYGGSQNDTLYGGTEADTAYGGKGDDTVYGDAATDTLYGDGAAADDLPGRRRHARGRSGRRCDLR